MEIVEFLLIHKIIDPNVKDRNGKTAEDIALENNKFDVLGELRNV
jgi:ankyrin repeat protein